MGYHGREEAQPRKSRLENLRVLFRDSLVASRAWDKDGASSKICAAFCARALQKFVACTPDWISLSGIPQIVSAMESLRNHLVDNSDYRTLISAREALRPDLIAAHNAPRKAQESGSHYTARTAHEYENFLEQSLATADSALALEPFTMVQSIWSACRLRAIYWSDSDPIGAVLSNIEEAERVLETELTALIRSLVDFGEF